VHVSHDAPTPLAHAPASMGLAPPAQVWTVRGLIIAHDAPMVSRTHAKSPLISAATFVKSVLGHVDDG
jgi:hypothetical protein